MKSRSGDITAYKATNMLIITDAAHNVRRMLRIVKELDVPVEGEKIWVVRLRNADAEEVHKMLCTRSSPSGAKAPGRAPRASGARRRRLRRSAAIISASKIVADTASNSLIIVASADVLRAHRLADQEARRGERGQSTSGSTSTTWRTPTPRSWPDPRRPDRRGAGRSGRGRRAAGAPAGRPAARAGGTAATLFEGDVKVSPDKATNSLVIVASTKDFLNLRRVISKLDIPRRQVFVEASILEIPWTRSRKLGLRLPRRRHGR